MLSGMPKTDFSLLREERRIGPKMRDLKVFAPSFELDILGLGTSTEKT